MSICKKLHSAIFNLAKSLINVSDKISPHISGLIDLGLRIWVGLVFWKSGVLKLDSWDSTLMLFEYEHPVPYLSPDVAAYLGTGNEIIMPLLLLIGLGSRIAAIALLFSTAIIQFTYMHSHEHFIWTIILVTIMIRGAGLYSIDCFIRQKFMGCCANIGTFSRYIAAAVVGILVIIAVHEVGAILVDSVDPWLDGMLKCWSELGK